MNQDDDTLELLTAFVDGELSPAEAQKVKRHMQADPQYEYVVNAERAMKGLLRTRLARSEAPRGLKQRVRAAVFGNEADVPTRTLPERRTFWQLLTWSPTTASVLGAVVLAALFGIVTTTFGGNRIFPYVKDVHAHHMNVAGFPIQFTGDHETVAGDTSKAAGFTVVVPHLGEGIKLEGSRQCALCRHPIVFIKYNGPEGRLSFFIIPGRHPAIWRLDQHKHDELLFYVTSHEGVLMAFWHDAEATYCLAAALPKDRLIDLACTACRQIRFAKDASFATAAPLRVAARNLAAGN